MRTIRCLSLLSVVTFIAARAPGAPQLSNFQLVPLQVHKNLQILAKNTSKEEVHRVMEGYNTQLGVECNFCHVENAPEKDDRPHKADARRMMKMVADLNARKVAYFGPRAKDNLVTCATCHRGKAEPERFGR